VSGATGRGAWAARRCHLPRVRGADVKDETRSMGRADAIYAHLPRHLQTAAVSAYGCWWHWLRQGGSFRAFRDGFLERERWSADRWHDWQTVQLREVLRIAAEAPHYREAWGRAGLSASDLDGLTLDEVRLLPVLSKEEVRADPDAFCPGGVPSRGMGAFYTSGSTGTPLTTYHSRADLRRGLAMRDGRYQGFIGISHRMPHATIRGRVVVPDPNSKGPFHRYNLVERQTYLSPYHLGPDTVDQYIGALRDSGSVWIEGYASATHDIAHMALERGIACPRLLAIVTTAEPSSERLRHDVRQAFGCQAHEDYGLVEEATMALECREGSLHLFPDAGFAEILDEQNRPCPPGQYGELVATSFVRRSQPFVRYRTGDLVAWSDRPCPCGREMPVLAGIEGRLDDIVIGADGRRVGRLSTVPKHLDGLVFTQFVQDRPGAVLVRVVTEGPLQPEVEQELLNRLHTRLGTETEIEIRRVESVERTARGKFKSVVSSVAQRR